MNASATHGRELFTQEVRNHLGNRDPNGEWSDATLEEMAVEVAEWAKTEIERDVRNGIIPNTVQSYGDLHDYVDANYYGGAFEMPTLPSDREDDEEYADATCWFWNRVQDIAHEWIQTGALLGVVAQPSIVGDLVRIAKPADDQEREARFTIVEDRGDRVLIELVCDLPIRPQECVAKTDILRAIR